MASAEGYTRPGITDHREPPASALGVGVGDGPDTYARVVASIEVIIAVARCPSPITASFVAGVDQTPSAPGDGASHSVVSELLSLRV